jgi:hypothetical protein
MLSQPRLALPDRSPGKFRKALERLERPSKLVKSCHNQADKGPGKVRKGLRKVKMSF